MLCFKVFVESRPHRLILGLLPYRSQKKLSRKGAYQKGTATGVANTSSSAPQPKVPDFNDAGDIDGQPVLDYDVKAAKEKPWRVPGQLTY